MAMTSKLDESPQPLAFITHSPETYPSKEPRIDESRLVRRKRRRTSPSELSVLEAEFRANSKPVRLERERIASRVGMTEKAVQIWFQNKRQQCRRNRGELGRRASPASSSYNADSSFDSSSSLPPSHSQSFSGALPQPNNENSPPPLQFSSPPLSGMSNSAASSRPPLAKRVNSVRLAMSADGKAEVVVRTPLRPVNTNTNNGRVSYARPATRFLSLPSPRELLERDAEAARCLLFLKSGRGM